MAYWILLRTICLVQIIVSSKVLADQPIIYHMCVDNSRAHTSFKLTCANGGIFDIDVRSGTGQCMMSEANRCYGKTPSLLAGYLNCYWRSNCVIHWPHDPIIVSENNGINCIGSLPSFLQISYRCFELQPKMLLIDICKQSIIAPELSADNKMTGIIRSHEVYPWDYSYSHQTCSVKFYWPRGNKLVVTVQHIELSEDDSLMIGHDKTWVNATQPGATFTLSDAKVTVFNFSVGTESTGGRGFLLCFTFIAEGTTLTDACQAITYQGDVGNASSAVSDNPLLTILQDKTMAGIVTPPVKKMSKRCMKKKTEKAKERCAKRFNGKGRKGKKQKKSGKIRTRKRGGKGDKKKRHTTRQ